MLDSHPTIRDVLRRAGALAAIVAIAYAAQVGLEAKQIPSGTFWTTGLVGEFHWLVVLVGTMAGTATAFGSLYLIHRLRVVQSRRAFNELAQDLTLCFCEGAKVPVDTLATHIWRVDRRLMREPRLRRAGVFKMDTQVPSSGVQWVRDKGAVGLAWSLRRPSLVELGPQQQLFASGPSYFNQASASDRLNLSYDEFQLVEHYWSVFVVPLRSEAGDLIGVATVGCTKEKYTAEMRLAAAKATVRHSTGAIQTYLRGD